MPDFAALDLPHALAGLLVGFLVGLTGVGGGSLMTPLLVLVFGVSPATAVGTDLLYAAITKTIGSAVHGVKETVDWKIVRRLATGSLPAAGATLIALNTFLKVGQNTNAVILDVLGAMLILTAIGILFQRRLLAYGATHHPPVLAEYALVPTIVLGAALGVLVTLSSIGAGAIGMTVLLMLYRRLPVLRLIGSDIAHAVPLALVAGMGHWFIGGVDATLLLNLLLGSIPGVIAGSLLASRAPDTFLRPALAAVLVLSGYKLLTH
ncbi:sulfite exporter TauE/SafE family protein [Novosphingobium sp.]|uniref:sulfite exporter TauE/SafE family protein n=1 Tax=Novosphingobium sp. TaxID=1874826 RepID=UPI0025F091F1|nr:sulfite exporter TauE/SafE family protein [Novosphingobium sp.]